MNPKRSKLVPSPLCFFAPPNGMPASRSEVLVYPNSTPHHCAASPWQHRGPMTTPIHLSQRRRLLRSRERVLLGRKPPYRSMGPIAPHPQFRFVPSATSRTIVGRIKYPGRSSTLPSNDLFHSCRAVVKEGFYAGRVILILKRQSGNPLASIVAITAFLAILLSRRRTHSSYCLVNINTLHRKGNLGRIQKCMLQ